MCAIRFVKAEKHAFTLVELLVVMAIISMLAALLLPALEGAIQQGRLTACSNQLKQIGVGAMQYDTDFGMFAISRSNSQAYGPKAYAGAVTPLYQEFQHYAHEYLGVPDFTKTQDWKRGDHGIFRCPSKEIPSGVSPDRTRIWHISYLNASVVNAYYAIWINGQPYKVTEAMRSECKRVYGYRGAGLGIRLSQTNYASALPLFCDTAIYNLGTTPEFTNHAGLGGDRMNAVYMDGSVCTQPGDPNWRGNYLAKRDDASFPVWYFPYVHSGTCP